MTQSWSDRCWKLKFASVLAISEAFAFSGNWAFAQITPDGTLRVESSVVQHSGNSYVIEGGATRGPNLFHSFEQFSVPTNGVVLFNNRPAIQNIISRVTGSSVSNIDGLIRANGTANLFLLNPNGIIFGRNASLNIGGSFVVSTASSLKFADGTEFSAAAPQTKPLLTISVPIGLQFGPTAGEIRVQGPGAVRDPDTGLLLNRAAGLKVLPTATLALVGSNVVLEGAILTTEGGRIELGSVASSGLVSLTPINKGFSLGYGSVPTLGDIHLSSAAVIDTSGEGSGDVQVQARRVMLIEGSQIAATTRGAEPGGTLAVTASDSVELVGFTSTGILTTETKGAGNAGDITINTRKLLVEDGAEVTTSTYGQGSAGQLTVTAPESVELISTSPPPSSGLFSLTLAAGKAGDITINTGRLLVQNRAAISAESTANEDKFGNITTIATGRGGNVTLVAPESVELNNGVLTTDTLGTGNAGNITITTGRLLVRDGAEVSTATFGQGKGGDLTVIAPESVELITRGKHDPTLFAGAQDGPTGISTGPAGNLTIATGKLIVRNGAQVTVSSKGTGAAGNLEVTSPSILLDNGAFSAETIAGQGNINLGSQDLVLRHGSQITTSATGTATGGNITIKTGVLTALENSDIRANAKESFGGRVIINAQGIFGTEFRQQDTPLSDITATSTLGPKFSGTVQINTLGINPSFGLVNLPIRLVDVTELIAQGCPADVGPRGSKFVVTGRGGLPLTPREALASEPPLADLGTTVPGQENRASAATAATNLINSESAPIVEATGWVTNAKGEVMLVANPPTFTPDIPWMAPTSCHTQ